MGRLARLAATLELMSATFPAADIVSAYGQTEMSGATTLLKGADATRKMGSVGKPMLGVELRLVDDELRDVDVGEVGEIVYRGPTVMRGYYAQPEATAEAFAGGWFHSGDLATRDEEGYLYDRRPQEGHDRHRRREHLSRRGRARAARAPGGRRGGGRRRPAPALGRDAAGLRRRRAGADVDDDELIDHCRARLAGYKKPSAVVFVDELPRNAAGKVLKRRLRESVDVGAAS